LPSFGPIWGEVCLRPGARASGKRRGLRAPPVARGCSSVAVTQLGIRMAGQDRRRLVAYANGCERSLGPARRMLPTTLPQRASPSL
jgi:hypothetical protein